MARSKWKGASVSTKRILKGKACWARNRRILGMDVGRTVAVYNGQKFTDILVEEGMVGNPYGAYVMSRKMGVNVHVKKRKKKK